MLGDNSSLSSSSEVFCLCCFMGILMGCWIVFLKKNFLIINLECILIIIEKVSCLFFFLIIITWFIYFVIKILIFVCLILNASVIKHEVFVWMIFKWFLLLSSPLWLRSVYFKIINQLDMETIPKTLKFWVKKNVDD